MQNVILYFLHVYFARVQVGSVFYTTLLGIKIPSKRPICLWFFSSFLLQRRKKDEIFSNFEITITVNVHEQWPYRYSLRMISFPKYFQLMKIFIGLAMNFFSHQLLQDIIVCLKYDHVVKLSCQLSQILSIYSLFLSTIIKRSPLYDKCLFSFSRFSDVSDIQYPMISEIKGGLF